MEFAGRNKDNRSQPGHEENKFATCRLEKSKLKQFRIFLIDQGFGRPRPQRGRPVLAEGEVANRVIERVTRLSQRYDTKVLNRDGVGVIEL